MEFFRTIIEKKNYKKLKVLNLKKIYVKIHLLNNYEFVDYAKL